MGPVSTTLSIRKFQRYWLTAPVSFAGSFGKKRLRCPCLLRYLLICLHYRILNEVRRNPFDHQDTDIWKRIEKVYEYHQAMLTQRRALHLAVGQLTLKAWDASHPGGYQAGQLEPSFITAIRSFTSRRGSSRANSTIASSHEYNPFDTTQDASEDLGASNFANMDFNMTNDFNFNGMAEFDSNDWLFWDQ